MKFYTVKSKISLNSSEGAYITGSTGRGREAPF